MTNRFSNHLIDFRKTVVFIWQVAMFKSNSLQVCVDVLTTVRTTNSEFHHPLWHIRGRRCELAEGGYSRQVN